LNHGLGLYYESLFHRAKICIAIVMLENRHTGISLGQIISTMFTCRIRISECQHDPGFIDLFTPMAESQISSGPHSVDVDGPEKESRKGTKKKTKRVKADSRPSPVQLLFFDRITAHNSSPFFVYKCNHRKRLAIRYVSIHYC